MFRRILAFVLFIALLCLVGCGPKEGLIVDKIHKPDLSYWGTSITCANNRCTSGPHWYSNPPEYKFILEVPDGDIKEKHVKRKVYYKKNIDDYYRES